MFEQFQKFILLQNTVNFKFIIWLINKTQNEIIDKIWWKYRNSAIGKRYQSKLNNWELISFDIS